MKIILAGGGTGGPVVPLLAVAEELKNDNPQTEFLFVGTKAGPEKQLVEAAGFNFVAIPAAKFRRYFSIKNLSDIPVFLWSFIKAKKLLAEFKPDVIFSVGGFVSVPIAWAAKTRGIKIVVHQQDAMPGLANRLVSPFAEVITTAFEETIKNFYSNSGLFKNSAVKDIEWVGNPVRSEFLNSDLPAKDFFKLHDQLPVMLITGGASGAAQINQVVTESLPQLIKSHQIVHITGIGKKTNFTSPNYHQYEFLNREMPTIMKMAHIVLCRAGLSTITELSALSKISIVVPMPDSHQEQNAAVLKKHAAAVVLTKEEFIPEVLVRVVNSLKFNVQRQKLLAENMGKLMPKDAALNIAKIIKRVVNESTK